MLVQQKLGAYLVPGSLVLGSQRPNKHIPDPMKFVTDMIGRRISFIHAVNMFWHLLCASFFVPRNIAVKEQTKSLVSQSLCYLSKEKSILLIKRKRF